jgi:hypothetical protein
MNGKYLCTEASERGGNPPRENQGVVLRLTLHPSSLLVQRSTAVASRDYLHVKKGKHATLLLSKKGKKEKLQCSSKIKYSYKENFLQHNIKFYI